MRITSAEAYKRLEGEYQRVLVCCQELEGYASAKHAKRLSEEFLDKTGRLTYERLSPYVERIKGKTVLDVGCKFGHFIPVFLLLGAKRVESMEVVRRYVEIGQRVFGTLYDNASVTWFDGIFLPLQPNSVDFVCMDEVISHVNPMFLDTLWGEVARVLKPGGALYISDGNNLLHEYNRKTLVSLYRAWEFGPEGTHTDRDIVGEAFASRRRKIIRAHYPALSNAEVEMLTANTSGLHGEYLVREIDDYLRVGALVRRPYRSGVSPVNAEEGGTVMERGFFPE